MFPRSPFEADDRLAVSSHVTREMEQAQGMMSAGMPTRNVVSAVMTG